jgi:hypothetical protein
VTFICGQRVMERTVPHVWRTTFGRNFPSRALSISLRCAVIYVSEQLSKAVRTVGGRVMQLTKLPHCAEAFGVRSCCAASSHWMFFLVKKALRTPLRHSARGGEMQCEQPRKLTAASTRSVGRFAYCESITDSEEQIAHQRNPRAHLSWKGFVKRTSGRSELHETRH